MVAEFLRGSVLVELDIVGEHQDKVVIPHHQAVIVGVAIKEINAEQRTLRGDSRRVRPTISKDVVVKHVDGAFTLQVIGNLEIEKKVLAQLLPSYPSLHLLRKKLTHQRDSEVVSLLFELWLYLLVDLGLSLIWGGVPDYSCTTLAKV